MPKQSKSGQTSQAVGVRNEANLPFHPHANLFPLLGEAEIQTLSQDIAENGLQVPITIFEGKILDGRNRHVACILAGIEPRFVEFDGDDPVKFVVSTNLHRRHLNESQRAMVAAKIANMRQGERTDLQHSENLPKVSQADAATILKVSDRSLRSAKKVEAEGVPEIIAAVESGKLPVSVAATIADAPAEKQREVIAKDDKKAILAASKEIRKEMTEQRRAKRTSQIVEAVRNNKPFDGSLGKFAVIYADPPWAYDSSESDMRVIENHYPTMTLDDICTLDVKSIAHDDAVLFLWTTSPKLKEAFQVLDAWNFSYRTCAVWDKERLGMGYYFRQAHEILLVATRGNIPAPAAANRSSSVIRSPRSQHSRKPEIMYDIIEAMYPQLPKVELFARNERPGWSRWGESGMSVLHDFHASLAESERIADASWWDEVYRKAFPYFESMEKVPSGTQEQKNGIDRIVHLQGGASILVDEKVRHDDYDDILLEIRSAEERQTPGWACKPLHCDYIAYAFLPSRRCYFLPFPLLQKALANNWHQWLNDCKRVEARNHGYTTVSLAVPIDTLQKAMSDASLIRWDVPEIIN